MCGALPLVNGGRHLVEKLIILFCHTAIDFDRIEGRYLHLKECNYDHNHSGDHQVVDQGS